MVDTEFRVTSELSVPMPRFIEWYHGIRPMPGQDAQEFFNEGVACGLLTMVDAAQLLERHRSLEAMEAQTGDPEIPAEVRDWLISKGWQAP